MLQRNIDINHLGNAVVNVAGLWHRSGEHMLGLIDGLLDLARIEAGRLQLEPAPLALPAFLDELVRMVRPQAENKGLAFVYTHLGRLPDWVQADAKRLRQILINLLANAVRFTEAGTVTLQVDARREVLRFDVIDTGPGVAPQDRQRILDKEREVVAGFAAAVSALRPELAEVLLAKPMTMLLFGMINWLFTWMRCDGALDHEQLAPMVADLFLGGLPALRLPRSQALVG